MASVTRPTDRVRGLFRLQISKLGSLSTTRESLAQLNQAVDGDAAARKLFWTLLYPHEQRTVFLECHRDRRFWPRIKPLVGSPPFSFLHPGESQLLNAGAIRANRTNMAHGDENATSSAAEVGDGHFLDGSGRKMRIVDRSDRNSGVMPFERLTPGLKLVCDLKIPKMANSSRLAIAKKRPSKQSAALGKITFPRVNDVIRFTPTSLVEAEIATVAAVAATERGTKEGGQEAPPAGYGVDLQIKGVVQRGAQSPVCRIFAVVTQT